MVSVEIVHASEATTRSINEQPTGPRVSFSADFLDETSFISITPLSHHQEGRDQEKEKEKGRITDFEFLSNNVSSQNMLTADELFFEGKLLPFWQTQHSEKLNKISLKARDGEEEEEEAEVINKESTEPRVNWLVDDDPSPRPPKCTVLWKELMKLKKQRASSLSPSSSSSSTSSSSSSLADMVTKDEGKETTGNREKHAKRIKKGIRENNISQH